MARTIAQIQQSIIDAKNADPVLGTTGTSPLSSTSNVAMWLLWTYIVAVCQWTLENLFDAHKSEVSNILATQKPHTLQWYVTMAKAFQYGVALPAGSDVYAVVPPADLTVLIVNYAAAVELTSLVRIKTATNTGSVLGPLSSLQLTALSAYMNEVKDAGVRLQITSGNADNLQLAINIFYDPLVLDNTGARLDGTETQPVKDAINTFLGNLPFNGLFVLNFLVDALQAVNGVLICQVENAQANYGSTAYVPITVEYVPDAGYMTLDNTYFDANVAYTAHGII
jgi:hypothetical protein